MSFRCRRRFCAISLTRIRGFNIRGEGDQAGAFSSTRARPALLPASDPEVVSLVLSVAVMRAALGYRSPLVRSAPSRRSRDIAGRAVPSFGT